MDALSVVLDRDTYLPQQILVYCIEKEVTALPLPSCSNLRVKVRVGHISMPEEICVRRKVLFADTNEANTLGSLPSPAFITITNSCDLKVQWHCF